jgi:hypothetical protein
MENIRMSGSLLAHLYGPAALQAENDDLEMIGLALLYRP